MGDHDWPRSAMLAEHEHEAIMAALNRAHISDADLCADVLSACAGVLSREGWMSPEAVEAVIAVKKVRARLGERDRIRNHMDEMYEKARRDLDGSSHYTEGYLDGLGIAISWLEEGGDARTHLQDG